MSVIKSEIRSGTYYDSVMLMQLQRLLIELPGILDAGVVMGTDANKDVLAQSGMFVPEVRGAGMDDMVIVVKAEDAATAQAALQKVDTLLSRRARDDTNADYRPKTLGSAAQILPSAQWQRDGQSYSLLGLSEEGSDSIWFLFADRTTGRETYGAGRFLYSDGMPENGRVVVDFNKAYNPPCAFSEFSTCPLPPQQNRLDLAVTAGERDYHRD